MSEAEISMLIALAGCAVSVSGRLAARDKKQAADSEWRGGISAKLDSIMNNLNSLVADSRRTEARLNELSERMIRAETALGLRGAAEPAPERRTE